MIELVVFDTERSEAKVTKIINSGALDSIDVILGPVYLETSQVVAEYAESHSKVMINLLNRRDEVFKGKEFVYSALSSYKTIGRSMADAAFDAFGKEKVARVYYQDDSKSHDSIIALAYKERLEELEVKVEVFKGVGEGNTERKNYEKSLRWSSDGNTGHVAVFASKNRLMASTLISVWENNNKRIPVIASKEWLDIQLISYEQFFRRKVHFVYPEYMSYDSDIVKAFKEKFKEETGVKPLKKIGAEVGYDIIHLIARNLEEYGTHFHKEFDILKPQEVFLSKGYSFKDSHSNNLVPLLKFDEDLNFIWVNSPYK